MIVLRYRNKDLGYRSHPHLDMDLRRSHIRLLADYPHTLVYHHRSHR